MNRHALKKRASSQMGYRALRRGTAKIPEREPDYNMTIAVQLAVMRAVCRRSGAFIFVVAQK